MNIFEKSSPSKIILLPWKKYVLTPTTRMWQSYNFQWMNEWKKFFNDLLVVENFLMILKKLFMNFQWKCLWKFPPIYAMNHFLKRDDLNDDDDSHGTTFFTVGVVVVWKNKNNLNVEYTYE